MTQDPLKSLPWYLIIFFLISVFILRRIGKFVGWVLVRLWPNQLNFGAVCSFRDFSGLTGRESVLPATAFRVGLHKFGSPEDRLGEVSPFGRMTRYLESMDLGVTDRRAGFAFRRAKHPPDKTHI